MRDWGVVDTARDEGREEGRLEGKREVARNMKQQGLSVGVIQQVTGLTIDEIENL
jgi:predicted transposase/invertase (TIGR01784 family)